MCPKINSDLIAIESSTELSASQIVPEILFFRNNFFPEQICGGHSNKSHGRQQISAVVAASTMSLAKVQDEAKDVRLDEAEEGESLVLPELPEPDFTQKRSEASAGVSIVVGVIVLILGLSYAVPLNPHVGNLPRDVYRAYFVIIHFFALAAFLCLERILRRDPGVIQRGPLTTFPMPEAVKERLREGRPLTDLTNLQDPQLGSYCVRCLVWRPPNRNGHHCSTCQRCVLDFDHHCGVFGRCIAGGQTNGNMPFFAAVICIGYTAGLLLFVFAIFSITRR